MAMFPFYKVFLIIISYSPNKEAKRGKQSFLQLILIISTYPFINHSSNQISREHPIMLKTWMVRIVFKKHFILVCIFNRYFFRAVLSSAKLNRKYKVLVYPLPIPISPKTHTFPFITSPYHIVTINESSSIYHYYPKSIVHRKAV